MRVISDPDVLSYYLLFLKNKHVVHALGRTDKNYYNDLESYYRQKNAVDQLILNMASWTGESGDN
jgi:hypothetical protein